MSGFKAQDINEKPSEDITDVVAEKDTLELLYRKLITLINADSSFVDQNEPFCVSLLLDIAEADIMSENCRLAIETIDKIRKENSSTAAIAAMYSNRLINIGFSLYQERIYTVAEIAFRMVAESGNISAKNNYAYMVRRHEISAPSDQDHILALRLLRDGVVKGDAFSLVNTALVFALMLGDDESWNWADSIFGRLSWYGGSLVKSWWEDLAKKGDEEGYLVIFFLLRHKIIDNEGLEPVKSIVLRLKKSINGFPEWLEKDYF